jgi:hypothetical protein
MNIQRTIAGASFIITAALATGILTQSLVDEALMSGLEVDLVPVIRPLESAPDPLQAMGADPAEFENQAYTTDDSPRIIGMDPGIYAVPAWPADDDPGLRTV